MLLVDGPESWPDKRATSVLVLVLIMFRLLVGSAGNPSVDVCVVRSNALLIMFGICWGPRYDEKSVDSILHGGLKRYTG